MSIKKIKQKAGFPPAKNHPSEATQGLSIRSESFQGPLPHPRTLAEYEQVYPGAAARILSLTESEAEHRRSLERDSFQAEANANKEALHLYFADSKRGQLCAVAISVSLALIGAYVSLHGAPWPGGLLGTAGVGGVVTTLIRGRWATSPPTVTDNARSAEPRPVTDDRTPNLPG